MSQYCEPELVLSSMINASLMSTSYILLLTIFVCYPSTQWNLKLMFLPLEPVIAPKDQNVSLDLAFYCRKFMSLWLSIAM